MWEQIQANRWRSTALLSIMGAMLVLMGYAAGVAIGGPRAGGIGVIVAFVIFVVQMLVYFFAAEDVLLHGANAQELSREDSPRLFNVVEEMAIASGLGFTPKIHLIDDPAPNAFAIGRKSETSAIGVTTGLLHRLNRDELQGVIGHEIGHLKNRDVQFMTLAAVMLGTIIILSELTWRWMRFGGRGRSRSSSRGGGQAQLIILAIALVLAILGPILAQILYFTCSRKREFLADACSAQYTRYPAGLASALEKISQARVQASFASKASAPLFIVNPLYAADADEPNSVFASHPPTSERIRILRSMAGASLGDYEAAYHQTRGGSLIGSASLQSAPTQTVRAPSAEGPIETRISTHDILYRANGYLHLTCSCGMEIKVPETFEQDEVICPRCGSELPLPSVKDRLQEALGLGKPQRSAEPPLQYTRISQGWESFRCSCGRTVQLSPAFAGSHIRCSNCGRNIEVSPPAA